MDDDYIFVVADVKHMNLMTSSNEIAIAAITAATTIADVSTTTTTTITTTTITTTPITTTTTTTGATFATIYLHHQSYHKQYYRFPSILFGY